MPCLPWKLCKVTFVKYSEVFVFHTAANECFVTCHIVAWDKLTIWYLHLLLSSPVPAISAIFYKICLKGIIKKLIDKSAQFYSRHVSRSGLARKLITPWLNSSRGLVKIDFTFFKWKVIDCMFLSCHVSISEWIYTL